MSSYHVCGALLQVAIFLHATLQALTATVEWRISNAWKDDSCTNICFELDLRCTERCWPTNAEGVKEFTRISPTLQDICFDVIAGSAATWHPAKDPENTICYWDPGSVSEARCPLVPVTPVTSVAQNKLIRRFCPCFNATSGASGGVYDIDDCGLGSAPVAALPTPAPAPVSPGPGPGPSPASPSSPNYGPNDGCSLLCVAGFEGIDSGLNGEYVRFDKPTGFSHWSREDVSGSFREIQIAQNNGRWQFVQVTSGGRKVPAAESKHQAQASGQVPGGDTYLSGQSKHEISFSCCGGGWSGAAGKDVAESKGLDTTVILVGGCALFAVAALLCMTAYLKHHNRVISAAPVPPSPISIPKPDADSIGEKMPLTPSRYDAAQRSKIRAEWADPAMRNVPELQDYGNDYGNGPLTWSSSDQPWHNNTSPAHTSNRSFHSVKSTVKATNPHDPFSPPPIQSRYGGSGMGSSADSFNSQLPSLTQSSFGQTFGGTPYGMDRGQSNLRGAGNVREQGRAAREVACVLGNSGNTWPSGQGRRAGGQNIFEEGLPVRIVGLRTEPTWDGAEGVVDGCDEYEGMVRIELPDGRTKSVPYTNCEPAARVPKRRDSNNAKSGSDRLGHGGRVAAPQGSVPLPAAARIPKQSPTNFPAIAN